MEHMYATSTNWNMARLPTVTVALRISIRGFLALAKAATLSHPRRRSKVAQLRA